MPSSMLVLRVWQRHVAMKPSSWMVESSLKKIQRTHAVKDASMVREGFSEKLALKKGPGERVFEVEETASAKSHGMSCKPGRTLIVPMAASFSEGASRSQAQANLCALRNQPGSGAQENSGTGQACLWVPMLLGTHTVHLTLPVGTHRFVC